MLLTLSQTKLNKNQAKGYLTAGLQLQPNYNTKLGNTCPYRGSCNCAAIACLDRRGMNNMPTHKSCRIERTEFLVSNFNEAISVLQLEIKLAAIRAGKLDLKLACRLNVLSDLPWEIMAPSLFYDNPDVQFYDYTRGYERFIDDLPENYWLTYSITPQTSILEINDVMARGYNCAAVFQGEIPPVLHGYEVVDGEKDDIRFLESGIIYGLRYKKPAKTNPDPKLLNRFAFKSGEL